MKMIKFFAALIVMFAAATATVNAQDLNKEQKKQVKTLQKEGWKVSPGAPSLATQIIRADALQSEMDADGYPKWLTAEGRSTGSIYNAARAAANTVAKNELASNIQTEITTLIEQKIGNDEQGKGEAESIMSTIQASKGRIIQKIGRVRPVMECSRQLPNGNWEVLLRIAYSWDSIKKNVKDAVGEEAEKKGESKMSKRLDEIMGW